MNQPSLDDLRRTAEILKKDAVLTPWPPGCGGPGLVLPGRPRDVREQLAVIEQLAPDIDVYGGDDGWSGPWEALIPGRYGETEVIKTNTLGEMIPALERVLRRRAEWRREMAQSAVDLLRAQWGDMFAVWWEDGWYWCTRHGDGSSHHRVPTPEQLTRPGLMVPKTRHSEQTY